MTGMEETAKNNNYAPLEARYKSEGERRIAAALHDYRVRFVYERVAPIMSEKGSYLVPDFYLPDLDTYIEFYGRAGNADYDRHTAAKTRVYERSGLRVVAVYPWDLCHRTWPKNLYAAVKTTSHRYGSIQVTRGIMNGYRRGRGY